MSRAVELVFLARRWRERERSNFCSKTIYTLYTLPFRRGRRYRSIPLPYPTATATLNYIFIPDAHFFPYSFLPFFLSRPHGTSGHEPLAAEYANKSLQCYSSNSKRPRIPRRRKKKTSRTAGTSCCCRALKFVRKHVLFLPLASNLILFFFRLFPPE